jgi:hypothetical protein
MGWVTLNPDKTKCELSKQGTEMGNYYCRLDGQWCVTDGEWERCRYNLPIIPKMGKKKNE